MTDQELFDKVAIHLLTQNKKAELMSTGQCAYRGMDGTKCAAGCLILDQYYTSRLEGCRADQRSVAEALILSGVAKSQLRLVSCLQRIHDSNAVVNWRLQLQFLAKKENLRLIYESKRIHGKQIPSKRLRR